ATGSTAYSLAAGGPILYPTLKGFVVTPINCHSLGHKPVVLPEDAFVDVIQMSSKPKVTLFIDGHILVPLTVHHKIRICLSDSVYKVGLLDKNFFFNNLSEKLHWR
ncbi:MAG: NAD(+) kinase, partial [Deltaproteobacteria bacterium]|nr:NAD(+) kinase [Deltaproteobacteria bacterium]